MQDDINLIDLVRTIWTSRRKVLIFIFAFGAFGLFVALVTPTEYTAKTIIVTRTESRNIGTSNLSGLAAMVGINLGMVSDAGNELAPIDYPDFIKSLSFQKTLMYTPIIWQRFPQPVTLYEYYDKYYRPGFFQVLKKYTIGLPGVIVGWFKGNGKVAVSSKTGTTDENQVLSGVEEGVRGFLTKNLKLTLNPNNNFIKLEARAPEAKAAAQLVTKARELLQIKVTDLKINKASQNLEFTKGLYEEKKKEFMSTQNRLAQFRDENANLGSEMAKTQEDVLLSDYQIAFSVYTELAKQLENAKIRVKEDTPIFSVIEEAVVPNSKSKPKTEMILLIWIFLGGVVGVVWVLAGRLMDEARKSWAENR